MQKVEGSSPLIRFTKPPGTGGFLLVALSAARKSRLVRIWLGRLPNHCLHSIRSVYPFYVLGATRRLRLSADDLADDQLAAELDLGRCCGGDCLDEVEPGPVHLVAQFFELSLLFDLRSDCILVAMDALWALALVLTSDDFCRQHVYTFRVDRFVRSVAGSVYPGGKALTKPC
jgi:hypothetical protein